MAMSEEEINKERKYLQTVKKILQTIINDAKNQINITKNSINEEKRFMWENLSDYTDEERALALSEVDTKVNQTNRRINEIAKYEKALQSPFFAKISFKEKDGDEMPIYIGITSVSENLDFYVFDWRAPISSMFYNYEIGKAKYGIPNGEIEGEILSKMQFKIVDGELLRCFKSNINIDDEYLQEILANASTDKMKNIVSTIQRDQNEIIRNTQDRYLIVQGVAGSGKTSVALHRIAYLLYKDLNLSYNNILIFSPNDVFSDYISNVLPELGEQNVLKTTFSDFAKTFLAPYKKIESYSEFLERVYNNAFLNKKAIQYKLSEEFQNDLREFFNNYLNSIKFSHSFKAKELRVSAKELNDMFYNRFSNLPLNQRLERIVERICDTLGLSRSKYSKKIKKTLIEDAEIELNFYNIYKNFLSKIDKHNINLTSIPKGIINYEDIISMLYITFEINGYPNYNHIRQVVIDEVQDYTKFQIEILKKIFKSSAFTILGDTNQTINPCYQYGSLEELSSVFNYSKFIELTKTYRSSEEIIDYSNKILGINNVCSVRRNNNIPVEFKYTTPSNIVESLNIDIEQMVELGIEKVAIITKNLEQAMYIYDQLKNNDKFINNIEIISDSEHLIKKQIVIIPSYLSKGLEFDGVIAYNDKENEYTSDEKKLYYVVCTRAQHKLSIYNEPQKILSK